MSEHTHAHETHPEIVKRLRRAEGQLRGIVDMIEAQRACRDIAQQLHAVEKAIGNAKEILIHDHLRHCLAEAVATMTPEQRQAIDEFQEITKYL